MKPFWDFVAEHKRQILGGLAGLIVGILFLTIGFFATLLLAALTALGAVLAGAPDTAGRIFRWITAFFRKLFKGNQGK